MHKDATGHGLGKRIYGKLIALGRAQGLRHLYASIVLPNPASVRASNIVWVFIDRAVQRARATSAAPGRDVAYYGLQLNDSTTPPAEPVPITALDAKMVADILAQRG